MAITYKAWVECNKCGGIQEIDPHAGDPFTSFYADEHPEMKGWLVIDTTHHLCPECAAEYKRRREEMERALRVFAHID